MASSTVETPAPDVTVTAESPVALDDPSPRRRWYKSRRPLLSLIALLAAAGVVVGGWEATRGGSSKAAFTVTTQQVKVTTGTIKETVSASGTIEPAQVANLDFAVSGVVGTVGVAPGQTVTKGQALASVDSTALQDQVAAAEATLSADESKLASDTSTSAATSQIDSDQAGVTSAQLQLSTAQTNLADATLTSTINGTVASVGVTVGQQVATSGSSASSSSSQGTGSSTASSGPGAGTGGGAAASPSSSASSSGASSSSTTTAQIVVVSTGSYSVSTTVDDTEVGQVKAGDQAVITPSGSTTPVYGTVSSVGLMGSATSGVASFPVTIAVTGTPSGLYAGATATVSIVTKQLNNVVEVPTAAISYSNGQATVTKVQGSKQASQPVTTGASASGETQVTSGVKAGDLIIEKIVKFNTSSGTAGSILGGTGGAAGGRGGFGGAGGFGGGGFGGGGATGGARGGTGAGG